MGQVRRARPDDVAQLAAIHRLALPDDLLPRLGRSFLVETFFPVALSAPETTPLVLESDGGVTSFVIFTPDGQGFARELRRRHGRVMRAIVTRVWRDPGLVVLLTAQLRGSRLTWDAPAPALSSQPELFVMATHPDSQGRGHGRLIVEAGLAELRSDPSRFDGCFVRTASPDARRFYERVGFEPVGREQRGRRVLDILYHRFDAPTGG